MDELKVVGVMFAVFGGLNFIAAITPSKADDKILNKVGRFLDAVAARRLK